MQKTKRKQTRLSMILLWKKFGNWSGSGDEHANLVRQFLMHVEHEMKPNKPSKKSPTK